MNNLVSCTEKKMAFVIISQSVFSLDGTPGVAPQFPFAEKGPLKFERKKFALIT